MTVVVPALEIEHVNVGFGSLNQRCEVLSGINLSVETNEFLAVIGFSGSGKTTLMNLLSGLQTPDSGTVRINGEPLARPGSEQGVLFQNHSLLPWLSVCGNIELAVRQVFPDMIQPKRREHVQRYVNMVSLAGSEWKKPQELSGGMRQRLSLARKLSIQPEIVLLDEPLSRLDPLTRSRLQNEMICDWEKDRRTVVLTTNDVSEAVLMADRIVVLAPGPQATFGRTFVVRLKRPRNRTRLNVDPEFQSLQNEITRYLMEIHQEATMRETTGSVPSPDLNSIDFSAA